MSEHHASQQSTVESTAAGSSEVSPSDDVSIARRVAACEKLVDETIEKDLGVTWLKDSLKVLGIKAAEAWDYVEMFAQRMEIRRAKARQQDSPPRELPAEVSGHDDSQADRDRAVEEAAWASLSAKIDSAEQAVSSGSSSNVLDKILELFSRESSGSTSLSKSVLDLAPHLAEDQDTVFEDPYLSETQKFKTAYASQKPFENLIIRAQGRKVLEPIANSIWKLVILDKYVDFEKLYVTLDPGYNPNDEARDLNEKFTLLEKNSISSKRPVVMESEWLRLFDIWSNAVLHFYPHRRTELTSYRELIVSMFRATSSPYPAIKFDRDSRERYSRQPYRLDSSKSVLPLPLLSQLLSNVSPSPPFPTGKKRSSGGQDGPRKRSETVCHNWNLGSCDGDTCHYGRRHNECSECGDPHRAKDRSACFTSLNRRRQQQKSAAARSSRA
jgi:hypothetical protein